MLRFGVEPVLASLGGGVELLDRNQDHLAEVRGGWPGLESPVPAHDLHAGL